MSIVIINGVKNKRCVDMCKEIKAITEFYTNKSTKDGLQDSCKSCAHIRSVARWANRDPEQHRIKIVLQQYKVNLLELLILQNYKCLNAKCLTPEITIFSAYVDHDHKCCNRYGSCGKCVRGLFCDSCNGAAGRVKDSPEALRGIAEAIEEYEARKKLIGEILV